MANKERVDSLFKSGLDSLKFSINAIDKNTYKIIHGTDNFNLVVNNLKNAYDLKKEKYNNIRWGVSIISKGNNKCEIYFDAFGECGSVNGINVCFEKNEMIGWIKKEIPLLSQKIGGL